MVKKLRCDVDKKDWVKAEVSATKNTISVKAAFGGEVNNVILTPSDARKLRKQIKKALEAIEGVDEEDMPTSNAPIPKFSVGDKVIITDEGTHGFKKGEEVTLVRYQPTGWQHYEASNGEEKGWLGFREFEPA